MKLNYKQVLPFCMCLTLGLGACSSDEDFKEDINVEQTQEKFSKLVIDLGGDKGDFEGNIARALTGTQKGNWEDGWSYVNPADPAPSQVYPLNQIYLFVRQASDEAWNASQDITVLKYDLDDAKRFTMEYLAKGNEVTLKSGDVTVKSLTPAGLDIMFVSQPKSVFETMIHPSLATPNGQAVYAPCGDVLFRSKEYTLNSVDSKFGLKQRGSEGSFEGSDTFVKNKLIMFRGSCSFNSKLIITSAKEEPRSARAGVATKGELDAEMFKLIMDCNMEDFSISTFIAPSSKAKEMVPYPNKFDFFAYKPSDKLVAGQAMFSEGGGIVALTKQARSFVAGIQYPGYPIDYPEAGEGQQPVKVDFEGVGKDFNYMASPYLYPFLIDGAYDLCFAITQKVGNGEIKQATLRFPIVNANMSEGQTVDPEGQVPTFPERLLTANRNVYTTIVLDINDFSKQWRTVATTPSRNVKGASNNVVDLESNVLDVPYTIF